MGTVVTFHVVGTGLRDSGAREDAVARAADWFRCIEHACSRFDPASELRQLSARTGVPTPVSAMLFEAIRFALAIAEETGGAFDPTVGASVEAMGFDTDFRSGTVTQSDASRRDADFRDVLLDTDARTVLLRRPLTFDLGAIAKGLAIDVAARELRAFENFAIDAGGDLYLAGCNAEGRPWSIGIRHPHIAHETIETVHLSNKAICTSGDYERRSHRSATDHHIVDGRSRATATALASATVVAESAMVADAFATAAFILGPIEGLRLLERHGLDGLLISPALDRFATAGMSALVSRSDAESLRSA